MVSPLAIRNHILLLFLAQSLLDIAALMFAPLMLAPLQQAAVFVAVFAIAANLLLMIATVRRWRWAFWTIMILSFLGLPGLLGNVLQFTGTTAVSVALWYSGISLLLNAWKVVVAILMVVLYRRGGTWGRRLQPLGS